MKALKIAIYYLDRSRKNILASVEDGYPTSALHINAGKIPSTGDNVFIEEWNF